MGFRQRILDLPVLALYITIVYDIALVIALAYLLINGEYKTALAVFLTSELLSLISIIRKKLRKKDRVAEEMKEIETKLSHVETILSESDDYIWREKKPGLLEWKDDMVSAMNWGSSVVTIDEFLEIFDYEYGKKIANVLANKAPGVYVQEALATVGDQRQWWEFRMSVRVTPKGVLMRMGALISIEERMRQEAEMIRVHDMLLNARERLGFVRSMLHEIRTPLNSIIGFSQLISSSDIVFTEQEYNQLCKDVLNENDALVTLIENMLTLSHLNNGTVQFNIEPTDVNPQIHRAVEMMSQSFERNRLSVDLKLGEEPAIAIVDGNALVQILLRLLDNSVKFASNGSTISIGTSLENDGRTVVISVSDQGPGIPEDKQRIIFNRFAKLNPYSQGVGIGLAIANEFAEKMKGSLSVKSEIEEGCTFYLKFRKGAMSC